MVSSRARTSDTGGSHEAAARMARSGALQLQKDQTAALVAKHPGMTSMQLAKTTGMDRHALARRLPELVAEGRVFRGAKALCPISKINVCTWWPVARGDNYALEFEQ